MILTWKTKSESATEVTCWDTNCQSPCQTQHIFYQFSPGRDHQEAVEKCFVSKIQVQGVVSTKYVQNMTQKMREIEEIDSIGPRPNKHCELIS